MSVLSISELSRDLSAARRPCVVDLAAYRLRHAELDRRLDDVTQRVIQALRETDATVEQVESAIMFAKIRAYKGDTPIIAASKAVKWVMQPQGVA